MLLNFPQSIRVVLANTTPGNTNPIDFGPYNAVAGWGFALRNHEYSGPAVAVINASNTSETQDVYFDDDGVVTLEDVAVYGVENTRVYKLYDQWGSEDLTYSIANSGVPVGRHIPRRVAHITMPQFGQFESPSTAADDPAWKVTNPLWVMSIRRPNATGLRTIFNVAGVSYMAYGLWHDENLHWRVDSQTGVDWANTSVTDDPDTYTDWQTVIGDASRSDEAIGYVNGQQKISTAFDGTIDSYLAAGKFIINQNLPISNGFTDGYIHELHVFATSEPTTNTTIEEISTAADVDLLYPSDWEFALSSKANVVVGGRSSSISSQYSHSYAIVGAQHSNISIQRTAVYAVVEE